MKTGIGIIAACLVAALVVFAGSSPTDSKPADPVYGFSVKVVPDDEFDDFVRCGMSIFTLTDEKSLGEPPSLRIMAGDSNRMLFGGLDGMDVTFTCGINAGMTEVAYEIAGKRDGQLVTNQLATIRLK